MARNVAEERCSSTFSLEVKSLLTCTRWRGVIFQKSSLNLHRSEHFKLTLDLLSVINMWQNAYETTDSISYSSVHFNMSDERVIVSV